MEAPDVYLQRNLSCEELDSDDLDGGLNLSDQEDFGTRAHYKAEKKQRRKKRGKAKANKYHQEADTNVFQVSLACLKNDV